MRKSGFELNTLTVIGQALEGLKCPTEKKNFLRARRLYKRSLRHKLSYLKKFSISGAYTVFPLEHRIFNALSFFSIIACILSTFSSWLIGLPIVVILLNLVCLALFGLFYYLSRFWGKYSLLVTPFAILTCILLSLLWFYNGGINGSISYSYLFALFSLLIISRNRALTALLIISNVIVVIGIEYYFPHLVTHYESRESHFWDIIFSFIWVSVIIAFGVSQLIGNYEKERTAQINQMQELKKLAQVHNRLFSIISHDLRAPLRSVQATLQLQKDGYLTEQEMKVLTEALSRQVNNTNALLDNLFFWSRNQMQGIRAVPAKTNLVEIIYETLELLAPLAERKHIRLDSQVTEPLHVFADPDMVKLILRNLVSNAIKFSDKDDSITVTATIAPQMITIGVSDTGIGISVDQQANLFKMHGASLLGTANEKGSGLGLFLCKEFVEENGGTIWVKSQKDKGTVFYFTLPAA